MPKLIFYKAHTGNCFDKAVGKIDGGEYSHVELVIRETDTHWITVGASNRDGAVRVGTIAKTAHWDTVNIAPEPPQDASYYLHAGYDWIGLGRTIWKWWPYCKRRWVCSTFIASLYCLPDSRSWGVQDIYTWARSVEK